MTKVFFFTHRCKVALVVLFINFFFQMDVWAFCPSILISSQPSNTSVCLGSSTSISVNVVGADYYQWQKLNNSTNSWENLGGKKGTLLIEGDKASLSFLNATLSDNGKYRCQLTNCGGTTILNSAECFLNVNQNPSISIDIVPPICFGSNSFLLPFTSSNSPDQYYIWSGNLPNFATVLSGLPTSPIKVIIPENTAEGTYQLSISVTNTATKCVSVIQNFALNIKQIHITTQPVSQIDCNGNQVSFSVVAVGGTGNLSYQWQRKKVTETVFTNLIDDASKVILGSSSNNLKVSNIGDSNNPDLTQYQCLVSDINGCSSISKTATLMVNSIGNISDQVICSGGNATFTVPIVGTPKSIKWQKRIGSSGSFLDLTDGPTISGTSSSILSLNSPLSSESGTYYRVIVTFPSSSGTCQRTSTTTQYGKLTVNLTTNPPSALSVERCGTGIVVLNATGKNTGEDYKWYADNAILSLPIQSKGASYTLNSLALSTDFYVSTYNTTTFCESIRTLARAIINPIPSISTSSISDVCSSVSAFSLPFTSIDNSPDQFSISAGTPALKGFTNLSNKILSSSPISIPIPVNSISGSYAFNFTVKNSLTNCVSGVQSLNIKILPLPISPTVMSPIYYCQNTAAKSLSATPTSNDILQWYDTNALGGSASTSAPVPNTQTIGTNSFYVSQKDVNNCESNRANIAVTVSIVPPAPATNLVVNYCKNQVASILSATATNGNLLLWYDANDNLLPSPPLPNTAVVAQSIYKVSQKTSSPTNCESPKAIITVHVFDNPVAPSVISPIGYCQDALPTYLSATAVPGNTILWYNTNPTGGTATIIAPIPSTSASVAGTTVTYFMSQRDLNNCESPRSKLEVYVTPKLNVSISGGNIFCSSGEINKSATLTANITGGDALKKIQWKNSSGNIDGANNLSIVLNNIVQTNFNEPYNLGVTSGYCQTPTFASSDFAVSKNGWTDIPSISGANVLCGNTATIISSSSINAGIFRWYKEQTDLSEILTGTISGAKHEQFTTPNISSNVYYFVAREQAMINLITCQTVRTKVVISTSSIDPPILNNATNSLVFCNNDATFTFSATCKTGNVWFRSNNENFMAGNSVMINPTNFSTNTTITVDFKCVVNGCESGITSTDLKINAAPQITSQPTDITACSGNTIHFMVQTNAAQSYQWQRKKIGESTFTPLDNSMTGIDGATSNDLKLTSVGSQNPNQTQYRCQISTNNCILISNIATLTVNDFTATLSSQTQCEGGSVSFIVPSSNGLINAYQWQQRIGTTGTWNNLLNSTEKIKGVNDKELIISNLSISDVLYYRCLASFSKGNNTTCNVATDDAKLDVSVIQAPTISSDNQTICSGGSINLSATNCNGTIIWSNKMTGSSLKISLFENTTLTATCLQGSCMSKASNQLDISVRATLSPPPSNTTPTNVCFGNALTFSAVGSNLLWYSSATGGNGSAVAPTLTTSGSYSAFVSQTIDGCESDRLQINAAISKPIITSQPSDQSDCDGNSVAFKILANSSTNIPITFQWQLKKPNNLTFENIANQTSNSLTINYLGDDNNPKLSQYRCIISEATCQVISNSATLFVNSIQGILPSQTICEGQNAIFDASNFIFSGHPSFQWQSRSGTSGTWNDLPNATLSSLKLIQISLAEDAYYRCKFTFQNLDGSSCIRYSSTSNGAKLTVNPKAILPTNTTPASICLGSTLTFSASGSQLTWYLAANDVLGSTIPPNYSVAGNYTAFVSQTSKGCESEKLFISAEIKPTLSPPPSNSTPTNVCLGNALTFSAVGTNLLWYSSATGGNGSTVATTFTTSGTYFAFVSQIIDGCESDRLQINAAISKPIITSQPSDQSDCDGNSVAFKILGNSSTNIPITFQWQLKKPNNLNFENIANQTSNSLNINNLGDENNPNLSQYRCVISEAACQVISNPASLFVNSIQGILPSQTICEGQNAIFDASNFIFSGHPSFQWQSRSGTSGTWNDLPNATLSSLKLIQISLAEDAYYRCKFTFQNLDGSSCIRYSSTSNGAKLTVNPKAILPTNTTPASICLGSTLTFSASGSQLTWYLAANDVLGSTIPPNYSVAGNYTAFVSQTSKGCESEKLFISAEIKPTLSPPPSNNTPTNVCLGNALTFSAVGSNLLWYSSATGGNGSTVAPTFATSGSYSVFVSQTIDGCESDRLQINAAISKPIISSQPSDQSDCDGNSVAFKILANSSTNIPITFQWQLKKPNNLTFENIANQTSNLLTINNLGDENNPNLSQYRCVISEAACQVISNPASIFVNSIQGILPSQTICEGQNVIFDASNFIFSGHPSFQWQSRSGTSGTWNDLPNATQNSLNLIQISLAEDAYYRCKFTFQNLDGSSCIRYSSSSNGAKLTVNPKAILPTNTTPASICLGSTLTFSAAGSQLTWYLEANDVLGSSIPPNYSVAGNYIAFVSQTSKGCESEKLLINAEIKPTISPPPSNSTPTNVCLGNALTFSAVGSNLLWYTTASDIISSTIPPTFSESGNYSAFVSQTIDGCESDKIQINAAISKPIISSQPSDQSDCDGNSVAFKIIANSSTNIPITFQWQLKKPNNLSFENIANQTSNSLTINNLGDDNNPNLSQYRCVISEAACQVISNPASLLVNSIQGVLPSQTICEGQNVIFDASNFIFSGHPSFQWQSRSGTSGTWNDLPNATQNSLNLIQISLAEDAYYRCKFTFQNLDGSSCIRYSSSSNGAKLTVNPKAILPTNTTPASICLGSTLTFSAAGSQLTWYLEANDVLGSSIPPNYSVAGNYIAFVSQTSKGCESEKLLINAEIKPTISPPPSNSTLTNVCLGNALTFSAVGSNLLWYSSATGGNGSAVAPTFTTSGSYSAFVSQTIDGCESDRLQISASIKSITIDSQPQNQMDCKGNSVNFAVSTLEDSLSYQWQRKKPSEDDFSDLEENMTGINGVKSKKLSVSSLAIQNPDLTQFRVIISANTCQVISKTATLHVNFMSGSLSSQSVCLNSSAFFDLSNFNINGKTIGFQWQFRTGTNVPWNNIYGANDKRINFSSLSEDQEGYYRCQIQFINDDGSTCTLNTDDAKLTINTKPLPPSNTTVPYICANNTLTFGAKGSNILWYETQDDKIGSTIAPRFTETGHYQRFATQTLSGCESDKLKIEADIKSPVSLPINTTKASVIYPEVLQFSADGLHLQWYASAQTKTFSTNAPSFSFPGIYTFWVNQHDDFGCESPRLSITSKIIESFRIINQPQSQSDCKGNSVSFTINVVSPAIISFLWQRKRSDENEFSNLFDGNGISGSSTKTLRVSSVGNENNPTNTQYRCLLSDGSATIYSNNVILSVNSLTGLLPNMGACVGSNFAIDLKNNFTITGSPISYQWQTRQGTNEPWLSYVDKNEIVQKNTEILNITNINSSQSAYYRCKVNFFVLPSNETCSEYTDEMKLSVGNYPSELPSLIYDFCQFDKPKNLSVTANSGLKINYYDSETSKISTSKAPIPNTEQIGTSLYFFTQTSKEGCESPKSKISVNIHELPLAPLNSTPSQWKEGNSLTFSAIGQNLRWYTSTSDKKPDNFAPVFSTVGIHKAFVSQVNINGCESFRTEITTSIIPNLKITKQPISQTDCQGNSVTFTITAKGNGTTLYQWQRKLPKEVEFVDLPESKTNSLTINKIGSSENPVLSQYRCMVNDIDGSTLSESVTLFVNSVKGNLSDLGLCEGVSANINLDSLDITGIIQTYQWQKRKNSNDDWLTVSTESRLNFTNITLQDSANYRCRLTFRNTDKETCIIYTDNMVMKVSKIPEIPLTKDSQFCQNSTISSLKISAAKDHILHWWESMNDTIVKTKAPVLSSKQAGITNYFVSQINKIGCESARTMFHISITPQPKTPTLIGDSLVCQYSTTNPFQLSMDKNLSVLWFSTLKDTKGDSLTPTVDLTKTGRITFFIIARDSLGCECPKTPISINIQPCIATFENNFKQCTEISAEQVKGKKWFDLYDKNGGLYASINPNGLDLGKITLSVQHYGNGSSAIPTTQNGTMLMSRYYDFKSSILNDFKSEVSLKIYYLNQELEDYKLASNSPKIVIQDFNLVHYAGINKNCSFEDNDNLKEGESFVIYKNVQANIFTEKSFYLQFDVSSFSEIGTTSNIFVLLKNYTAEVENNSKKIKTTWEVKEAVRPKKYLIQRSENNKKWAILAEVKVDSLSKIIYELIDYQPLSDSSYYRLVSIDADGTKKFFDPIKVVLSDEEPICSVFPNPVIDSNFNLYLRNIAAKEIQLWNILGQQFGLTATKNDLGIISIRPNEKLKDTFFVVTIDDKGNRCVQKVFFR